MTTVHAPMPSVVLILTGLLGIAVSIGALTSWPWGVMVGGAFAFILGMLIIGGVNRSPEPVDENRALLYTVPGRTNGLQAAREKVA